MINYDTIVFVDPEVQEKVDFYRPFLEKSEFGTFFQDVIFTSEDPADGKPSAGLNGVRNFLFLYGLLFKEEYKKHYDEIESKRKNNPNANYYMLFCQDKYCACAPSVKASGSVKKTYSIGILEDDELDSGKESEQLRKDVRALKLISLAMAVYMCNKGTASLTFDNYYVTASVELSVQNIYFAIMHELSKYADEMNEKKSQIESNNVEIEELMRKEPKICECVFPKDGFEAFSANMGEFSDYTEMEELRCKMESEFARAEVTIRKNISKNVEAVRKAEAIAEEISLVKCVEDEITHQVTITEEPENFRGYMTTRNAGKEPVPTPDDILKTIEKESAFDGQKIKSLLPLAREIDKVGKGNVGKVFLSALAFVALFVLCVGAVYLTRYLKSGLNGATVVDFVNVIAVPSVFVILAGLIMVIVCAVIKHFRKSIFEDIFKRLGEFFNGLTGWYESVCRYLNKYLTVYYNHHVKHARISRLEENNVFLEKEIKKIREKASLLNEVAETVCILGGEDFEQPDISFAMDRSEYKSSAIAFETRIRKSGKTEVFRTNNSVETPCPWLKKIVYETGNINGGVQ